MDLESSGGEAEAHVEGMPSALCSFLYLNETRGAPPMDFESSGGGAEPSPHIERRSRSSR